MHQKLLLMLFTSLSLTIDSSNESSSSEKCYFINQQNKETWKLVWQDNFQSENVFKENWEIDHGICHGWGVQMSCNLKDNVQLQNGCLVMSAKEEKYDQWNYTGAMLITKREFGYGRFEARTAHSLDRDVYSLFHTHKDTKDKDGYIIMHEYNNVQKSYYSAMFPHIERFVQNNQFDIDYSLFHLYGMEWSEMEIKFFVDDHYSEPVQLDATRIIRPEQYIRFWHGVFGHFMPLLDKYNWKCPHFIVDYVRVYKKVSNPNFGLKLELCEEQNDVDQSSKKQREFVNSICSTKASTTMLSKPQLAQTPCNILNSNSTLETSNTIQNLTDMSLERNWERCGIDWEPYKNEKCFQILEDDHPTYSFESAIEKCTSLEDMSTLVIIESEEEQQFLSNFLFKIHKKVDNFWIGAKYSNNSFRWLDNSEMRFTNWHSNYPSKKRDITCVQMLAEEEEGLTGKWKNDPCLKRNAVVCQKIQLWSIEQLQKLFLDANRKIRNLENKISVLEKNHEILTQFLNSSFCELKRT